MPAVLFVCRRAGARRFDDERGGAMAGYFLYTLDNKVFTQLTTAPTLEQGLVLADYMALCKHIHAAT